MSRHSLKLAVQPKMSHTIYHILTWK